MLQWDALGETRFCFGGASGGGLEVACAALDACTLPLVVHDYHRAAVLGTATLLMARGRPLLLTAAHVLEGGVRLGNILVPMPSGHRLVPLTGARVACCGIADIAVIDISGVAGVALLLRGRSAAGVPRPPLRRRKRRIGRESGRVLLSGYPAVLSRFEHGWLGARRFTMVTRRREEGHCASARIDHLFDYGHVACRADGVAVHTPELQGMSGAGIWILEPADDGPSGRLRLVAVQSSYMHGAFVRGHDIGAAQELLRG